MYNEKNIFRLGGSISTTLAQLKGYQFHLGQAFGGGRYNNNFPRYLKITNKDFEIGRK